MYGTIGLRSKIGKTNDDAKAVLKKMNADKELRKLFDDPDEDVRVEARIAVKRIGD